MQRCGKFYKRKKQKLCQILISACIMSLRAKGWSTGCHQQYIKVVSGLHTYSLYFIFIVKTIPWDIDSWTKAVEPNNQNFSSCVTSSSPTWLAHRSGQQWKDLVCVLWTHWWQHIKPTMALPPPFLPHGDEKKPACLRSSESRSLGFHSSSDVE